VLETLGEPVTGTSANISGRPSAFTADEALAQLGASVDAIVIDDATVKHRTGSSVVEITEKGIAVHRQGVLSLDELRSSTPARVLPGSALPEPLQGR
jgi:L-threonylcarbamoyladenylate synthase